MIKKLGFILSILFPVMGCAQTASYLFSNKGQRDGLSHNFCFTILKDSRGMIWAGTINGLNRYDGYHFNTFYARNDSNSFINNTVLDLCEDKEGNIWGATSSGIFCYIVQQNRFVNYIPPGYDYARAVHNIICDRSGNIWATGLWNILKLDKQKNRFEEIGPLTTRRDSLGFYSVRQNGMEEDPSGKGIWMATRMGLHYYDIAANKFYNFKNKNADTVFVKRSMAALSFSRFGYFWVFDNTTREIIAFDPASYNILRRIDTRTIIPDAVGQTLYEDSNHRLWISTWSGKMAVLDYTKNTFSSIGYKNENPLSIAGDGFWAAWEDKDNTMWLGTAGGLSKCNYSKSTYSVLPVSEIVKEFEAGKIGAVTTDPRDASIWLASEARLAVIHFYPETGRYTFYDLQQTLGHAAWPGPPNIYNFIFIENQPYVVTHKGTWHINENTGHLTLFTPAINGLAVAPYYQLGQHGDYLWFSTYEGYVKWNSKTGEAKLIKAAKTILPDSQVINHTTTYFDKNGTPWFIPAFGWLGHVNERNEVDLHYYIKDKPRELASYISNMQFDSKGKLWMSSIAAGVYRFDPAAKKIDLFDNFEGIGTNAGYLAVDKQDQVWMVSSQRVSVYNQQTGNISSYYLPLNENTSDYSRKIAIGTDGSVYFTSNKSIIRFMPERLNLKPVIQSPLISLVKFSGREKLMNDESILKLEPEQNSLEIFFGSLINQEVFPYGFEYRLDGFDKQWMESGNTASALYSNLQPGKYTFRVKAISKNKSWETPERILEIIIRTPFYKARWFWLLIGSLLMTALILLYRFRLYKQKQILTLETKAQQLEKEKAMVMYESLKQQLNPHFLFNSLNSLSGLIETDQQTAGRFLDQMSDMYRYILKNGGMETVPLRDELKFAQLYINLQTTRFGKGLVVKIDVPDEYYHFSIAPVTLQNMMENAIKHNIIDPDVPLVIEILADEQENIWVRNNLQRKSNVETSNKKGLAQFIELYRYLTDKPVIITEEDGYFTIKIPLV